MSFLASDRFLFTILLLVFLFGVTSRAQQQIELVKQFPDGSYLVKIDNIEHWAVNLEHTKELKKAENDAVAFKSELQDERVKYEKLNQLYSEQSKLFDSCMALSKNGPKILGDWRIDLGFKVAPVAVGLLRRCN